jgi:hypothetical protein
MRKAPTALFAIVLLTGATGCGDNWPKLLCQELALNHEYNDVLMKIVDDDSAKFYKETHIEKIKNAWQALQTRKETYIKIRFAGITGQVKTVEELKASKALADLKEEIMFQFSPNYIVEVRAVLSRRNQQCERLAALAQQLPPGDANFLTQMVNYDSGVFTGQHAFNRRGGF